MKIQEKVLEIGWFMHVGLTPIDAVMSQALQDYLKLHLQIRLLHIHLLTRSINIRNCIEGKPSHCDFSIIWHNIKILISLQDCYIDLCSLGAYRKYISSVYGCPIPNR